MSSPHHPHAHVHAHYHDVGTAHRHTHGTVDPTILTTQRGLWAIKWSFVALGATALIQVVIVWMSGSVTLLADIIHNVGDAATVLPLMNHPPIRYDNVRGGSSDCVPCRVSLSHWLGFVRHCYEGIKRGNVTDG